jgi:putative transposase
MRTGYATDLTDDQWAVIESLLPPPIKAGAPRTVSLRAVVNSILYLVKTGCQWRMLPNDFGVCYQTVYHYFAKWRRNGIWEEINDALVRRTRLAEGRSEPTPSASCIDSQSAKGTDHTGNQGYDGNKKVKGRKRHVLTDTLGLLLVAVVTPANADDGATAPLVLERLDRARHPRLETVFADNKYNNKEFDAWRAANWPGLRIEIQSKPADATGFVPLKKRWAVERTFAWYQKYRRNAKDYERTTASSEAMIYASSIHIMLRRLTRSNKIKSVANAPAIPA